MNSFLQNVAHDLHHKLGNDFSRTIIVFPNRRAGLFLNEALLELAQGKPMWAPRYMTINELFRSFVPEVGLNDPIDSTLRIVDIFRRTTGRDVTVDWFYGWAERLLSDFDDVDKNRVDAEALFRNVGEWRAFDDLSFLTEEQVSELQRFFSEFDPGHKSELRERYRQLWDALYDIYSTLRRELAAAGTAYEGALYRQAIERLHEGSASLPSDVDRYVIVGFNVLDRVEHALFSFLQRQGRALFYWDYDVYYASPSACHHEAGLFMRQNLHDFPNELPSWLFDNLAQPRRIEMVSASTEAIQAQYAGRWVTEHLPTDNPQQLAVSAPRTAVVLCNENLLQPVLHALPECFTDLNVTKGFPLSHTEVATMVEHQMNEWERQRTTRPLTELLEELSKKVDEDGRNYTSREGYCETDFQHILQGEAYYQMFTILNRFARVLTTYADSPSMTIVTLRRLLRHVVRQTSIPFHGEPVVGLQVMGMLETRCLDFDRVLMLSVNDGTLPQRASDNSFIPLLLRHAFGLTTPERRTAVFAYYFYRLLQRPEIVTMTYNTSTEGMATGEMSRFMKQLLIEWPHPVLHRSLNSLQKTVVGSPAAVDKPDDLLECLTHEGATMASLSPSALACYLKCPVQFYYRYVRHIKEPKTAGEVAPNVFGSIFHAAAESIYKRFVEKDGWVEKDFLLALADNQAALHQTVQEAVAKVMEDEGVKEYQYPLLEAHVIEMYLSILLKRDAEKGHFRVLGTETAASCFVIAKRQGQDVTLRIGGVVDRIDLVPTSDGGARLCVLDYKTGGATMDSHGYVDKAKAESVEQLFAPGGKKAYMLQTFLYDKMLHNVARHDEQLKAAMGYPVVPSLFFVTCASRDGYNPFLRIGKEEVTDLSRYTAEFDGHLTALLNEILDPSQEFLPTDDRTACDKCAYKLLCHK